MEDDEVSRRTRKKTEHPKKMKNILKNLWNVGKEDTRRLKHALKVGVSLTLVSLLYLMEPFFKGIGKNAIWAVMTVVVVLEFSAGNYIINHLHFVCLFVILSHYCSYSPWSLSLPFLIFILYIYSLKNKL